MKTNDSTASVKKPSLFAAGLSKSPDRKTLREIFRAKKKIGLSRYLLFVEPLAGGVKSYCASFETSEAAISGVHSLKIAEPIRWSIYDSQESMTILQGIRRQEASST